MAIAPTPNEPIGLPSVRNPAPRVASSAATTQAPQDPSVAAQAQQVRRVEPAVGPANIDPDQMQQLTEALQTNALTLGRDINFEVNDTLGKTIVRVMDSESGDLIRQVPPEAVVQAAVALAELIGEKRADPPNGLLVQTKA